MYLVQLSTKDLILSPIKIRLTIDRKIFSKQVGVSNFINMPFEVIEFKYKPELDTFLGKYIHKIQQGFS